MADCSSGWDRACTRGADCLCPIQWEKSQLDEEFMHSVENVCGCAKYECGEQSKGSVARAWAGQPGGGCVGSWALDNLPPCLPSQ